MFLGLSRPWRFAPARAFLRGPSQPLGPPFKADPKRVECS
jgi:hypothetical protein